jgi:hypothetical protein
VKVSFALLLLIGATAASAQVPGTDIYLVPLVDGAIDRSATPVNATARPGYDNQPGFLQDSSGFRYTVIDSTGQADVWLFDLATGDRRNLTANATSEYSATPMHGDERFSVVRVEPDSTQRLWSFAPDGGDPQLLFEDLAPVGYHAWGREGEIALFILGSPHALHRARLGTPGSQRIAGDIGRCLQAIPGEDAWSFPLATEGAGWSITRLDRVSGDLTAIAPAPLPEVQDYCWTPDGQLWSSDGQAVLGWSGAGWTRLRDFAPEGISGITRMAVSPDGRWLALVADDPAGNR